MYRHWYLVILFFISCGGDNTVDLNKATVLEPSKFIKAFKPLQDGVTIADSNITKLADTVTIHPTILQSVLGNAVFNEITKNDVSAVFKPIGSIEKPNERYVLVAIKKQKKYTTIVLAFDKQNNFLTYKTLLEPNNLPAYYHQSLLINKEPTFFVTQEKKVAGEEVKFTKIGWALSGKNFITIVRESNELGDINMPVINPIDTFAAKQPFSGDYVYDEHNYISIRDGKTPKEYLFFITMNKEEGHCKGELKGKMHFNNPTVASYSENGDPCEIDFVFEENKVSLKENNSCGNRRSGECSFNEVYTKTKLLNKATKNNLPTATTTGNITPKPITPKVNLPKKDSSKKTVIKKPFKPVVLTTKDSLQGANNYE